MNYQNQHNTALIIVCLILAAVAMGVALFSVLTGNHPDLAVSWFIAATICAILPFVLPFIQKLNVGGVGLETRGSEGTIASTTSALQDIDLYLEGRGDVTASKIMEKLETLNQRHLDLIYQYMDGWRVQQILRIIKIKRDEKARKRMRKELSRLIPLLESLIFIANGQDYDRHIHYYYACLAYVYKDMEPRVWSKAYENINYAIEARKETGSLSFTMYEFNRLICLINKRTPTQKDRAQMKLDFEATLNDPSTKWMLADGETHPIIAPGLTSWLKRTDDYWQQANPPKRAVDCNDEKTSPAELPRMTS